MYTGVLVSGGTRKASKPPRCEEVTRDGWDLKNCCVRCHGLNVSFATTRQADGRAVVLCCRAIGWSVEHGYTPTQDQLDEDDV